jgi:hypothetical protein
MTINNLISFSQDETWPKIIIFWGTHWNERAGLWACQRLIENIKEHLIELSTGTLIIVNGVNERAIEDMVRGMKDESWNILDMNRFFRPNPPKWYWYEYRRSRELMPIIESADYLLDLHSTSWPSYPYAFAENKSIEFTEKLWIGYIVSGWWSIRSWEGWEIKDSPLAWDIESYATEHWAIGITFESGNHNSPDGEENAYQIAINLISRAWMLDPSYYKWISNTTTKIHMTRVYKWTTNDFHYAFNITSNFMSLKEWDIIWYDWDTPVIAPEDCILVMPTLDKNSSDTATGQKDKNIFQIWRYTHI